MVSSSTQKMIHALDKKLRARANNKIAKVRDHAYVDFKNLSKINHSKMVSHPKTCLIAINNLVCNLN